MQTLNQFNGFHQAVNHLQALPPNAQHQAFEFIEFLRQRCESSTIVDNNQPTNTSQVTKRQAGSLSGLIVLADDFDEQQINTKVNNPVTDEQTQINDNKLSMAGCLSEYAKPDLIEQENKLMNKGLTADLEDKYFAD